MCDTTTPVCFPFFCGDYSFEQFNRCMKYVHHFWILRVLTTIQVYTPTDPAPPPAPRLQTPSVTLNSCRNVGMKSFCFDVPPLLSCIFQRHAGIREHVCLRLPQVSISSAAELRRWHPCKLSQGAFPSATQGVHGWGLPTAAHPHYQEVGNHPMETLS